MYFFAVLDKIILCLLTNVSHSLTISDNQVYSNDEFDLRSDYSGERFRASFSCCHSYFDNVRQQTYANARKTFRNIGDKELYTGLV